MALLLSPAVLGGLVLAVLSTAAGGFPELVQGGVLFAVLGAYLGWRKGQAGAGLVGGLLSGIVAAGSFYLLAPIGGDRVVLVSWLLIWVLLAALQTYLDDQLDLMRAFTHGTVSAVAATFGFAVILAFPAVPHFLAWSLAYIPGLHVLLQPRKG